MSLSTKQLKQMKEELRRFSSLETSKIYSIVSQIYKANITPQQLIDSEITKGFARIALKHPDELGNDEKRQKSVKIARKLVRQWKQTLGYYEVVGSSQHQKNQDQEVNDTVRKQIKKEQQKKEQNGKEEAFNEIETPLKEKKSQKVEKKVSEKKEQIVEKKISSDNKNNIPKNIEPANEYAVDQETRDKAIQGLVKYLRKHNPDCDQDIAIQLEMQSFHQNKNNINDYRLKVKKIVMKIDQDEEIRQQLFDQSVSVKEILKSL